MSSFQDMRWLLLTFAFMGCAAPKAQLRPKDPTRHEQFFVAVHTTEPRAIVIERQNDLLRLVERSPEGTRAVGPAPTSPELDAATWELLGKLGFVPFTDTVARHDALQVSQSQVQAAEDAFSVDLFNLGSDPVEIVWRTTPQSRFIGLEVRFGGIHETRAAYLVDPKDARKKLLIARASQAHAEQHYARAVIDYTDALALDPTDTIAAYNLACALSRLGQYDAAITQLRAAITTGGPRYQDYARQDPDLAVLKSTLAFSELVGD